MVDADIHGVDPAVRNFLFKEVRIVGENGGSADGAERREPEPLAGGRHLERGVPPVDGG